MVRRPVPPNRSPRGETDKVGVLTVLVASAASGNSTGYIHSKTTKEEEISSAHITLTQLTIRINVSGSAL